VTPPGIDPGTIRLVAQCHNHYATRVHTCDLWLVLYLKVPCGTLCRSLDFEWSQPTSQPIHSSTGNQYQTQNLPLVCTTHTESLTYMIHTNPKPESWTSFDYNFCFVYLSLVPGPEFLWRWYNIYWVRCGWEEGQNKGLLCLSSFFMFTFVLVKHTLACCCHFDYFQMEIMKEKWFSVIIFSLLSCLHVHLLFDLCLPQYMFCGCKVIPAQWSPALWSVFALYWYQACVVRDFWCEVVLLYQFTVNWTDKIVLHVQFMSGYNSL
jgi:hypothetical protein